MIRNGVCVSCLRDGDAIVKRVEHWLTILQIFLMVRREQVLDVDLCKQMNSQNVLMVIFEEQLERNLHLSLRAGCTRAMGKRDFLGNARVVIIHEEPTGLKKKHMGKLLTQINRYCDYLIPMIRFSAWSDLPVVSRTQNQTAKKKFRLHP
jgi:hypothetical protein